MQDVYRALLELQALDEEIEQAKSKVEQFAPQLQNIEAPLTALERETEDLRNRLGDMRRDVRRLEQGAEQKRDKLRQYEERVSRITTAREEAAYRTELDLIRRAADADDQEAVQMMDQITRSDLRLDELQKKLESTRTEVAPQREELLAQRSDAEQAVAVLQDRRTNLVGRIDPTAARLYDRVRGGKRRRALAPLTADGACGSCFNVLPVQQQAEVRRGETLMRCEACGVILYAEG